MIKFNTLSSVNFQQNVPMMRYAGPEVPQNNEPKPNFDFKPDSVMIRYAGPEK